MVYIIIFNKYLGQLCNDAMLSYSSVFSFEQNCNSFSSFHLQLSLCEIVDLFSKIHLHRNSCSLGHNQKGGEPTLHISMRIVESHLCAVQVFTCLEWPKAAERSIKSRKYIHIMGRGARRWTGQRYNECIVLLLIAMTIASGLNIFRTFLKSFILQSWTFYASRCHGMFSNFCFIKLGGKLLLTRVFPNLYLLIIGVQQHLKERTDKWEVGCLTFANSPFNKSSNDSL